MQPEPLGGAWIERVVGSRPVRAAYASLLSHVLALLILALMVGRPEARTRPVAIALKIAEATAPEDPAAGVDIVGGDAGPAGEAGPAAEADNQPSVDAAAIANTVAAMMVANDAVGEPADVLDVANAGDATPPAVDVTTDLGAETAPAIGTSSPAAAGGQPAADAFGGRSAAGRAQGVEGRGGSAASEAAVARGLEWLARHQAADGSWRFDLSGCRCDGACRNPGSVRSTTAATGIALLPFLGAGYTHERGEYAQTVTRGLYYLMSKMRATPRGGDLSEGTMYGHGTATLALAEALGMTKDRMLVPYVRDAVRFLETSQDMHSGGWRYLPGQLGDTTVTAWQLAALKSAALAGVAVPSPTIHGISEFLDRVQVRGGEGYGYMTPQYGPCTSAIGLLCRIYMGWPEQATLDRGLARLAARGPEREAVYRNFYLAQALLLREHAAWPRWNARNRDQLVARQERIGHETGSWIFDDPDTLPGGRLGHTALAVLTLEVYYRLLPIYTDEAATLRW
jgi:hypothetical protein